MNKKYFLLIVFFFIVVIFSSQESMANNHLLVKKEFQISQSKRLVVKIPENWNFTANKIESPYIANINFISNDKVVRLFLSFMSLRKDESISNEKLKKFTSQSGVNQLSKSVDKVLDVKQFSNSNLVGYYYSLTDKVLKSQEYKFSTEGNIATDRFIVIFTILATDFNSQSYSTAFNMLKSIKIDMIK